MALKIYIQFLGIFPLIGSQECRETGNMGGEEHMQQRSRLESNRRRGYVVYTSTTELQGCPQNLYFKGIVQHFGKCAYWFLAESWMRRLIPLLWLYVSILS